MKIIVGFIVLVVVAAAIGGMGGSDDESTAAPAVDDSPLVAEGTDTDAARVDELAAEGQEIVQRILARSTAGQSDPATACRERSINETDVARVHEIAVELDQLGFGSAAMEQADKDLTASVENVARLCVAAGF